MIKAPKTDNLNVFKIGASIDNPINPHNDNDIAGTKLYEQLKYRENSWWQARQRLIQLKERQIFWFGDNSIMMWLLWQLVSYVVVAIVLMLASKLLDISLSLWHYLSIFGVQTLVLVIALIFKSRLANYLQQRIDSADLVREQALTEMTILASDSIFPYVHASAPLSLQAIHQHYKPQLKLASIQRLLQTEIDAGRLVLDQHQIEAAVLPPEFIDEELAPYASEMVYKSLLTVA